MHLYAIITFMVRFPFLSLVPELLFEHMAGRLSGKDKRELGKKVGFLASKMAIVKWMIRQSLHECMV